MREMTDDELERFNQAVGAVLKADPALVRAAMEQEKKKREAERKAIREVSSHASNDRDLLTVSTTLPVTSAMVRRFPAA